jgi:hypothetical protein
MGSFEAPVVVPELKQAPLKVSSVLLSTQLQTAKDTKDNPLIRNGEQLVPNLTHIIGKDQKMTFYYEVYDPAAADDASRRPHEPGVLSRQGEGVRDAGRRARAIDDRQRKAAVFQLELPPASLPPGLYTCQINIIDSVAEKFAFPRLLFLLR